MVGKIVHILNLFQVSFNNHFFLILKMTDLLLYLGEPLRNFINNTKILVYQGNTIINLIDYLPLLKSGYVEYDDIKEFIEMCETLIYNQYLKNYDIAFNGKIPTEYYDPTDFILNTDTTLNTHQLIKLKRGDNTDFNYYAGQLIDYNSYDIDHDEILMNLSRDKKFLVRLEYESGVIEDLMLSLTDLELVDNKISLQGLMKNMKEHAYIPNAFYNVLSTDDRIKLYIAIIEQDINKIKDYLITIDPRFDDNQAYVLAVKIGDKDIIELIKKDIIKREWHEKQVYLQTMGIIGSDIRKTYGK